MLWNILSKNNVYWLSFKINTANKSYIKRTKQKRLMLMSNCTVCDKKKLRFFENKLASGILEDMGQRITLSFALIGTGFGY